MSTLPVDDLSLECDAALRPEELDGGTWIVLFGADGVPHVSLLQAGVCHSLEVDGNRRHPAAKLRRLLESRRVPALLCLLAPEAPPTVADFYAPFERIAAGGNCFLPVRDYCASWVPAAARCELAYELLARMVGEGKLARTVALHLPLERERRFVLPRYTATDVERRLAELRRGLPPS